MLSDQTCELLRRGLFVEPLPEVSRVVFICTPHRGSFVAGRNIIANLVRRLLTLPSAPRWTLQIRPNVDSSKPAKGAGAQAACVVARSLMRDQVAFSGDTAIAPTSEIGAPEAGARCVIHVRGTQEALRSL